MWSHVGVKDRWEAIRFIVEARVRITLGWQQQ